MFNEFSTKFITLNIDKKSILDFLNSLDAFRRPERLRVFLIQIQHFLNFHNMEKEREKVKIFSDINTIIDEKIEYGDLKNLNVNQIKERVEHINLNIINLVLSKKDNQS